MDMDKEATGRSEIDSIKVVESFPQLRITLSQKDAPTVLVGGMSFPVASKIPWGDIIDGLVNLYGKLKGTGGATTGGGEGTCTTVKITNKDGSTTEVKQCDPPPK